jgi:hypothetical protein
MELVLGHSCSSEDSGEFLAISYGPLVIFKLRVLLALVIKVAGSLQAFAPPTNSDSRA